MAQPPAVPRGCSTTAPVQVGQGRAGSAPNCRHEVDVANCDHHNPFQPHQHSRGSDSGFTPVTCTCLGKKFARTTFHWLHRSPERTWKRTLCLPQKHSITAVCSHSEIPNSTASGAPTTVLNSWKKYHVASNSFCLWYWRIAWFWLLWQSCRKPKELNTSYSQARFEWNVTRLCYQISWNWRHRGIKMKKKATAKRKSM